MIDLGLSIVVTNFSSHEWAFLHLDSSGAIAGDPQSRSRLVSLGRMSGLWFLVGAILFVMIGGFAGGFLFASKGDSDIHWQWPWLATILASGVSLWCLPFFSLLEGCGQMEAVYRFRMFQAINTNFCVWAVLLAGGGLWAAAASATFRCLSDMLFIVVKYRVFFRPFLSAPEGAVLSWRSDIWPVQWRLAAGGLLSYFSYFLFTPVLFYFHSEKLAGQMGMTRQLLVTVQSAAQSWVQTRVPEFSRLIAKREFFALDQMFYRILSISTAFLVIGGVLFLVGVVGLQELAPKFADRLLPVTPTLILLLGMILFQLPFGQTLYLRAHRKEPVFLETLASNTAIAAGVWFAGRAWEATGAATGYLLAVLLVTVPGIHMAWIRFRRQAHSAA
jgi:O-antigen/teichoic acid export membrane protein